METYTREWLEQNGYDGLYCVEGDPCGCENSDLEPCLDDGQSGCKPGYKKFCPTPGHENEWAIWSDNEPKTEEDFKRIGFDFSTEEREPIISRSMIKWEGIHGSVGGVYMFFLNAFMWPLTSNKWRVLFKGKYHECESLEAAYKKADELYQDWLTAANLISQDQIFSCEKCGDSGKKLPEKCPEGCQYETVCEANYCVRNEPCPCLEKPYSIRSIINRVKERNNIGEGDQQ